MASPAGVVRLLEQALEELYAKRSLLPLVDYVRGLADAPRDFLAVDRHTWGAVCQAASDWIARQALGAGTAAKQKREAAALKGNVLVPFRDLVSLLHTHSLAPPFKVEPLWRVAGDLKAVLAQPALGEVGGAPCTEALRTLLQVPRYAECLAVDWVEDLCRILYNTLREYPARLQEPTAAPPTSLAPHYAQCLADVMQYYPNWTACPQGLADAERFFPAFFRARARVSGPLAKVERCVLRALTCFLETVAADHPALVWDSIGRSSEGPLGPEGDVAALGISGLITEWMWRAAARQDDFRLEFVRYFQLQLRVRPLLPGRPAGFAPPLHRLLRAALAEGPLFSRGLAAEAEAFLDLAADVLHVLATAEATVGPDSPPKRARHADVYEELLGYLSPPTAPTVVPGRARPAMVHWLRVLTKALGRHSDFLPCDRRSAVLDALCRHLEGPVGDLPLLAAAGGCLAAVAQQVGRTCQAGCETGPCCTPALWERAWHATLRLLTGDHAPDLAPALLPVLTALTQSSHTGSGLAGPPLLFAALPQLYPRPLLDLGCAPAAAGLLAHAYAAAPAPPALDPAAVLRWATAALATLPFVVHGRPLAGLVALLITDTRPDPSNGPPAEEAGAGEADADFPAVPLAPGDDAFAARPWPAATQPLPHRVPRPVQQTQPRAAAVCLLAEEVGRCLQECRAALLSRDPHAVQKEKGRRTMQALRLWLWLALLHWEGVWAAAEPRDPHADVDLPGLYAAAGELLVEYCADLSAYPEVYLPLLEELLTCLQTFGPQLAEATLCDSPAHVKVLAELLGQLGAYVVRIAQNQCALYLGDASQPATLEVGAAPGVGQPSLHAAVSRCLLAALRCLRPLLRLAPALLPGAAAAARLAEGLQSEAWRRGWRDCWPELDLEGWAYIAAANDRRLRLGCLQHLRRHYLRMPSVYPELFQCLQQLSAEVSADALQGDEELYPLLEAAVLGVAEAVEAVSLGRRARAAFAQLAGDLYPKAGLKLQQRLLDVCLPYASDPEHGVRLAVGRSLAEMVALSSQPEERFEGLWTRALRPAFWPEDRTSPNMVCRTAIQTVAGIGRRTFRCEPQAVYWLLEACADPTHPERSFAGQALHTLATRLGLRDVAALLALHLRPLLYHWLGCRRERSQPALDRLPVTLFGYPDLPAFLRSAAGGAVVGLLLYLQWDAEVGRYAALLGLSPAQWVDRHFAVGFAHAFLRGSCPAAQQAGLLAPLREFLGRLLPQTDWAARLREATPDILLELLGSATLTPSDYNLPLTGCQQVIDCCAAFARELRLGSVGDLLATRPDLLPRLLLFLLSPTLAAPRHKVRATHFAVLQRLLSAAGAAGDQPAALRLACHLLAQAAARHPPLRRAALGELRALCAAVLDRHPDRLGPNLELLTAAAGALLEDTGDAGNEETRLAVIQLLDVAILRASSYAPLQPYLAGLALPASPALEAHRQRLDRLAADPDPDPGPGPGPGPDPGPGLARPLARLARLRGQGGVGWTHYPLALTLRRIAAVCQRPTPPIAPDDAALPGLLGALQRLCAGEEYGDAVRLAAAEALGHCGRLRPADGQPPPPPPQPFEFFGPGDLTGQATEVVQRAMERIRGEVLRQLLAYLCDDEADVVLLAADALFRILQTAEGRRAAKGLPRGPDPLQELLKPFAWSPQPTPLPGVPVVPPPPPLEDEQAWDPLGKSLCAWVCAATPALLASPLVTDAVLRACAPLCRRKAPLAELLFPAAVLSVAHRPPPDSADAVEGFRRIVSRHVDRLILADGEGRHPCAVRLVLHTLLLLKALHVSGLRQQGVGPDPARAGEDCWLTVDFFAAAKGALRCGDSCAALLFLERGVEVGRRLPGLMGSHGLPAHPSARIGSPRSWTSGDAEGELQGGGAGPTTDPRLPALLLSCYAAVGDVDFLHGVPRLGSAAGGGEAEAEGWLQRYRLEGQWQQHLALSDCVLQATGITGDKAEFRSITGVLHSLNSLGLRSTAALASLGLGGLGHAPDPAFEELRAESAWRCLQWQEPSTAPSPGTGGVSPTDGLHRCLQHALHALRDGDAPQFLNSIAYGRDHTLRALRDGAGAGQPLAALVGALRMLADLDAAWAFRWGPLPLSPANSPRAGAAPELPAAAHIAIEAALRGDGRAGPFPQEEPRLALRTAWLAIVDPAALPLHLRGFARRAARVGNGDLALATLRHPALRGCPEAQLQEAKLLWRQGQPELALSTVHGVLRRLGPNPAPEASQLGAKAFLYAGRWLGAARLESSDTVRRDYLQRAAALAAQGGAAQAKALFALAAYVDALHTAAVARRTSAEAASAREYRRSLQESLEAGQKLLANKSTATSSVKQQVRQLQAMLGHDEATEAQARRDEQQYLQQALEGYARCLACGDKYDTTAVFRLCALWLGHHAVPGVAEVVKAAVERQVPLRKFLPLVHQLVSRLGPAADQEDKVFQSRLQRLLRRVAAEHPFHTLYHLYALANGAGPAAPGAGRGGRSQERHKADVAKALLAEFRKDARLGKVVEQTDRLVQAYIQLAEFDVKKAGGGSFAPGVAVAMAPQLALRGLKPLPLVPILTEPLGVGPEAGDQPHVHGFEGHFTLCGGIHLPKIVRCMDQTGRVYKQLVKGEDDLRQDAVMQQIFGLVRQLLQENAATRQRRLHMRTYKVVPLSPKAGVVQWVEDTVPLGQWLVLGPGAAHPRYHPGDLSHAEGRRQLMDAQKRAQAGDGVDVPALYDQICSRFTPVMHHFFLENFPSPAEWFARRLQYTRSAAVGSMVGYVVGLGDRHINNILIDQASADLIHIDLGIAFDQGRLLPTPERVPFRLTRDVVDGMGLSGVEGLFRRSCEQTLALMRNNSQLLQTVMEVFLYDPLYNWTLDPILAARKQPQTPAEDSASPSWDGWRGARREEVNDQAARALQRVREKLQGAEDGELLSVAGHVQRLIQQATAPDLLCHMFPGWSPWV